VVWEVSLALGLTKPNALDLGLLSWVGAVVVTLVFDVGWELFLMKLKLLDLA